MMKKIYLGGLIAVFIFAASAALWYYHKEQPKTAVNPQKEEDELARETENLSNDVADLDSLEKDSEMETLDDDLSVIAEETSTFEDKENNNPAEKPSVSPIPASSGEGTNGEMDNLQTELSDELDVLSDDMTDMESYGNDNSLGDLDDSLSGISQ